MSEAAIETSRLQLVLLPSEAISALLGGDRTAAEKVVGFDLPHEIGGEPDRHFLKVQLQRLQQLPSERDWLVRLMLLQGTGSVVGSIGFHGPPSLIGRAEMGYAVLPPWRRRGYATEAALAMIEWAKKQGPSPPRAEPRSLPFGEFGFGHKRNILTRLSEVFEGVS